MPGIEQLVDVLPALRVARAGHVGVRELVDEHPLGLAGEDRVDVHLLERDAAVLDLLARHDLEVARAAPAVFGRPWVSTYPTTMSLPRSCARLPSFNIA